MPLAPAALSVRARRHLMGKDDAFIPKSRLSRLAHMASLTARTAGDLAVARAKRALGDETGGGLERAAAQKVLETLGQMKGAAMKLGQQLAMQADELPPEMRDVMAKLFSQAKPVAFEEIREVVERELGKPLDQLYAAFDPVPLAAASLGQVHAATRFDGASVVVKVQYPGVAEALESDLANMSTMVRAMGAATKTFMSFDTGPYAEEIRREIGAETDYRRELERLGLYRQAASVLPELHVPAAYEDQCTGKVLTLERVLGVDLKAFADSDADAAARWRVGRQLGTALMGPFLREGLVHADPHPGNFLVRADGRLTVLDFGAIKRVSMGFVRGFWGLIEADLAGRKPDYIPLFTQAGFTFKGDLVQAEKALEDIQRYARVPIATETFDWAQSTLHVDLKRHFTSHLDEVRGVLPPPESVLFYRALGGLAQNLKLIRANGPYAALCRDLSGLLAPA
jgi:predicted unusual protein kinase regulating ubiquinone biosynthesis (AarF/ABC1/UbiB family)